MKKILLFFLLNVFTDQLYSQPDIDTVAPGIKSITILSCGYSIKHHRDSTGLLLLSKNNYDEHGRLIMEINLRCPDDDDDGEENSFYGEHDSPEENICDTTFYSYNEKGLLITQYGSFYEVPWKTFYTYNAEEKCIREEHYSNSKLSFYYSWNYDTRGKLTTTLYESVDPQFLSTIRRNYFYDNEGRSTLVVMYEDSAYHDSTLYYYSEKGKSVVEKNKSGFQRMVYDENENLISLSNFSWQTDAKGNKIIVQHDSSTRTYDQKGNLLEWRSSGYDVKTKSCEFNKYDNKGRLLYSTTTKGADTTEREIHIYDSKLNSEECKKFAYKKMYLHYVDYYNSDGKLIESRYFGKKNKIEMRDVYVYEKY